MPKELAVILCHCSVVSDHEVTAAIESGAAGLCGVAEACSVGTRCGGCLPEVRRLLATRGLPVDAHLTARDLRERLEDVFAGTAPRLSA